jgi:hypothetical protein
MAGVSGTLAKLGMGAASPVTEFYDFLSEGLALTEEIVDGSGIVGSRSRPKERARQGIRRVTGSLNMQPSPVELNTLLPWVLGGVKDGATFEIPLTETLPEKFITIDRVQKVFTYNGCKASRMTVRGAQGQPVQFTFDVEGKDETVAAAGSFPGTWALDLTAGPYMFHEAVISVAGTPYNYREFELTLDNGLDGERFLNSQTRTEIMAHDRLVTVSLTGPYGDNSATYGLAVLGVAVLITLTNGIYRLIFSMPAVQFPRQSPTVEGRSEIFLPLNGVARKSGASAELTVTNDTSV